MSELSKEALDMAQALSCCDKGEVELVAVALQQLMDERDSYQREWKLARHYREKYNSTTVTLGRYVERAEAAEAQLAEAERLWGECRDALHRSTASRTRECQRAAEAHTKLAALIADMREQLPEGGKGLRLGEILDKYEAKQ
jgi:hypothetical protein